MTRRNFIIVDDMPVFGEQVSRTIGQYYNSKGIFEYDIKQFITETHFADSLDYIKNNFYDLDIVFSDQNLRGGSGTDLFKAANKTIPTDYRSIVCKTKIFKVMHSNMDTRFKEYQDEYLLIYNRFVNSEIQQDITTFLDYYEEKIISVKAKGNIDYNNYLYTIPSLQYQINTDTTIIDKKNVILRNILFLVMDKDDTNSEYYHFFYMDGEKIIKSSKSKKTDTKFNNTLKELSFVSGNLLDGNKEKFKINPLWISCIDSTKSTIKLLLPLNITYEIAFEKLTSSFKTITTIDRFFL